jgi:hypothetical protein
MLTDDSMVFAHPDGVTYVAHIHSATLGTSYWYRWPAEAGGWTLRVRCSATLHEECWEYDAFHAALALSLSGVDVDREEPR